MASLKVYAYKGCSTCKNALKFLDAEGVDYQELAIRETPPSKTELKTMLKVYGGELRKLFNTSGQDYRALGIKDKLPTLSTDEALDLLAANGNLVKRPFAIAGKSGIVGFKEPDWKEFLAGL